MHHRRGLLRHLKDEALVARIADDFETAGLDDRRRTLLRFAAKLTRTPSAMERADVDALRAVGLDDRDVLEVVETTAYYAYANRIVDGLGVELED